jgi:hypothetical protein
MAEHDPIQLPMTPSCDPDFADISADVVLRSSVPGQSQMDFRAHKVILSKSSSLLAHVFAEPDSIYQLPHPPGRPQPAWDTLDTVDVLVLPENSNTIRFILKAIYPVFRPSIDSLEDISHLICTAQSYRIDCVVEYFRDRYARLTTPKVALRSFVIARNHDLHHEAAFAARQSLLVDLRIEQSSVGDLRDATGQDISDLQIYHVECLRVAKQELQGYKNNDFLKSLWSAVGGPSPYMCNSIGSVHFPKWFRDFMETLTSTHAPLAVESEVLRTLMMNHASADSCRPCSLYSSSYLFRAADCIQNMINRAVSQVCCNAWSFNWINLLIIYRFP